MTNNKQDFIDKIKVQLEFCNYGFQLKNNPNEYFSYEQAKQMPAVQELFIRLNLWKATNKLDEGIIDYPEANRKIVYKLHPLHIHKCRVDLLTK